VQWFEQDEKDARGRRDFQKNTPSVERTAEQANRSQSRFTRVKELKSINSCFSEKVLISHQKSFLFRINYIYICSAETESLPAQNGRAFYDVCTNLQRRGLAPVQFTPGTYKKKLQNDQKNYEIS